MTNSKLYQELKGGKPYLGFRLVEEHYVDELQCSMWILLHTLSGARLAFFDSQEDERCFSLSFRAFPEDDTGVFHIIEHCVIEGSEKHPVRDWSARGPVSSFFSAFTSRDNVMFPVASKNEESFQELVKIYTDCVFAPRFLNSELQLMQEGWHYEYDTEADKLSYSGIVYSEMQASYDMTEYILSDARFFSAFPGTAYSQYIGGNPEAIPELSYEHFIDCYKRFFKPENCLACVWGNTSLSEVLKALSPYFESRPAAGNVPKITGKPAQWSGEPFYYEYPVLDDDSTEARDILGFSWTLSNDRLSTVMAEVVKMLLEKPLSAHLAQKGIEGEHSIRCDSEIAWPLFTFLLRGADRNQLEYVRTEINEFLTAAVSGLTDSAIDAAVSAAEFALSEGPELVPKGVQAALDATASWVHNLPLNTRLKYKEEINTIRQGGGDAISRFITEAFLENSNHTEFILAPSPGLSRRRYEAEQDRLKKARAEMDAQRLNAVIERARGFYEYQNAPDSSEALEALPKTYISSFGKKAPEQELERRNTRHGEVLYLKSNEDIIRMTLYFPVRKFDENALSCIGVLGILFGGIGAKGCPETVLSQRINSYTGEISARPEYYSPPEGDRLFMELYFSTLPSHFSHAQELIRELISRADYYGSKKAVYSRLSQWLESKASAVPDPAGRVRGYFSHGGAAAQSYGGAGLRQYVKELLESFDDRFEPLCRQLTALTGDLFDFSRSAVGVSCNEGSWRVVEKELMFPSTILPGETCTTSLISPREVFRSAGRMQYIAMGGRLKERKGSLLAVCQAGERLLSQQLRDVGGAYTVRMSLYPENDVIMLTGRDPNLGSTLEAFCDIPRLIAEADDELIESSIVSAASTFGGSGKVGIGGFTRRREYSDAARYYWNEIHGSLRQRLWEEIRSATPEQIRREASLIEEVINEKLFTAWASEQRLKEDRMLFDTEKLS